MQVSAQDLDQNSELIVSEQPSQTELRSLNATNQSQRVKQSVPKLSLHKVQSIDSKSGESERLNAGYLKPTSGPLN